MTLSLRAAKPADAQHIANLVNLAAGGLPASSWARKAAYGQDPMEIGQEFALTEGNTIYWGKTTMAEMDGAVAGLVISYVRPDAPIEITSAINPLYRPLIRLENMSQGCRFVNVLATYPDYRKRGIAEALLAHAEADPGPNGTAIVVSNGSDSAESFTRRMGFAEKARLPMIRGDWDTDSTEWLLMHKA